MVNKQKNNPEYYNDLFGVIAQEALMGFITFKMSGNKECIYTNKLASELLELNQEDHSNFKLESLEVHNIPEDQQMKGFTKELCEYEGLFQDIIVKKSNGIKFIANIGVKHLELNGEKHLLLMLQDVTIQKKLQKEINLKQEELKKAFEDLLEQNRQLKELDVAKTRFIALTTHELRTPLSAMVGSAEILQMGVDDETERTEFINMITEQGHHLMELVNDILDFAKIQSGKMDFYIHQADLSQLVKEDIELLSSVAQQSNITINFEDSETERLCYFDDVRIKQVVNNILSNAIKYNRENGSVTISIKETDDFYTVNFKDTGKGIPADQVAMVFNEFETLGKVANHQKGTGLGMPISRKLIEGQGGEIDLTSEVGVGTTFWIKVPKNKVLDEACYRERPAEGDLLAS